MCIPIRSQKWLHYFQLLSGDWQMMRTVAGSRPQHLDLCGIQLERVGTHPACDIISTVGGVLQMLMQMVGKNHMSRYRQHRNVSEWYLFWAPYRCVDDEALCRSAFTFTFTFTCTRRPILSLSGDAPTENIVRDDVAEHHRDHGAT